MDVLIWSPLQILYTLCMFMLNKLIDWLIDWQSLSVCVSEYDGPKGWWTSGSYVARSRRWMWIEQSRMRPMSYWRWADGEPNARSTMHCMLLYKDAGYRWHDATCTDRHTFICEMNWLHTTSSSVQLQQPSVIAWRFVGLRDVIVSFRCRHRVS